MDSGTISSKVWFFFVVVLGFFCLLSFFCVFFFWLTYPWAAGDLRSRPFHRYYLAPFPVCNRLILSIQDLIYLTHIHSSLNLARSVAGIYHLTIYFFLCIIYIVYMCVYIQVILIILGTSKDPSLVGNEVHLLNIFFIGLSNH